MKNLRKPVHDKVIGATLGSLITGLVTAELTRRLHWHLLPEEFVGIGVAGAFAGGWLKRITRDWPTDATEAPTAEVPRSK